MTEQPELSEKPPTVWPLALFWLCAWIGTSAGGGVFGAFGGPVGIVFGIVIAGIVGGPIQLAMMLLTIVGPLVRYRYLVAVMGGALTGIFSVRAAEMDSNISRALAALIGGLGTYFVLRWCLTKSPLKKARDQILPTSSQFSLRDTFVFFTIVVTLCAVVASLSRVGAL